MKIAALVLLLGLGVFLPVERSVELRVALQLMMLSGLILVLFIVAAQAGALPIPFIQHEDFCVVGPIPEWRVLTMLGLASMFIAGAVLVVHVGFAHPGSLSGPASGRLIGNSILVVLVSPYVLYHAVRTAVQRPRVSIELSSVSCGRKAFQWSAVGDFEIVGYRRTFAAKVKSVDGKTRLQFGVPPPDTPEGQALARFVTRFWGRPPNYRMVAGHLPEMPPGLKPHG